MSVLNTMLRDLEKRGVRPEQSATARPPDRVSAPSAAPELLIQMPARKSALRPVLLLLAAIALGGAAFWLWQRSTPTLTSRDHRAPKLASTAPAAVPESSAAAPTPSAQPLLAPPITPTAPAPAVATAPSSIAPAPSSAPAGASEGKQLPGAKEGKRAPEHKPADSLAPTRPKSVPVQPVQSHAAEATRTAEPAAGPVPAAEPGAPAVAHSSKQSEVARAMDLIARGRSTEAAELLAQALAAHPDLHDARATLAALQAEGGDRRQALATLLAGVPLDARRFALTAAQLQAELDNTAGALQTLDRIPVEARGAAYHALAAAVAQRAGQHQLAVTEYGAALGFDPANTIAWVGMGISLQALGRDADALQAFRSAARATLSAELRAFVESRIRVLKTTTAQAALPAVAR
jgi:MSHA biogenesis protein MshN